MTFKKISADGLDVVKKRRVQTCNYSVSVYVENFDCGALVCPIVEVVGQSAEGFGISKREFKVSNGDLVNSWRCCLNGN